MNKKNPQFIFYLIDLQKTAFIILAVSKCTYDKGLSHCSLRTEVTNFISEKVEQITHTYQPK